MMVNLIVLPVFFGQVVGPSLHYDQQKFELEDRLLREASVPSKLTGPQLEVPVRAQALNYRLPYIPTYKPRLLSNVNKNITTYTGGTVVLPCRVLDLGTAAVSWIRRPELIVLSHADILFSSSDRLTILHAAGSVDWNLQISDVNPQDSGEYECQVNTEPKVSRLVYLTVSEPDPVRVGRAGPQVPALALQADRTVERRQRTEILASPVVRVEEGGSIVLECVVTEHDVPPKSFSWYIGETALDFHIHRGGILLQEETKRRSSASRLTLTKLKVEDSAVYTCSPEGGDSASVRLIVESSNKKRRTSGSATSTPVNLYLGTLLLYSVLQYS